MSNQRVLLHLGTGDDEDFQHQLAGLTAGEQVAWKSRLSTPATIAEIEFACAAKGVTGIVCSNEFFLSKLLNAQPDFIPPNNKRGITLDDYQGSLLFTPREKLPVVIINPLKNLITVNWAKAAAKRFITKLTRPDKWFVQSKFTWEVAKENTIEETFERWRTQARLIAIDIETPDPCTVDRRINCVGYCAYFPATGTTECLVIPFTSVYWHGWVKKFNNLPQPKVFQGGQYDNLYFLRWGVPVHNWLHDTYHLFHSWYSEFPKRLDFVTAYSLRSVRYWKDDGKSGNILDYYRYCAQDCWATLNSYLALLSECPDFVLTNYLQEFPLVFPTLHCECEGVKCDQEQLAIERGLKEQEILVKEKSFRTMISSPNFNVGSWQQMLQLFKVLGLSHLKSTGKAEMLKAQASTPLNNRILTTAVEIKKAKKIAGTYLVVEKLFHGRWHYRINPAGTDTGRLNSTESSYWCGLQWQNIPREDLSVKRCAIADDGWLLGEIDKSQAEARCVGYLAGDTKLIAIVEGENDYHSWNAAAFFGIPYHEIYDNKTGKKLNPIIRDLSKRTNHGANYNMGGWMLLETMGPKHAAMAKVLLKLPRNWTLLQVCEYLIDRYAKTYPQVKGPYYDSIIKEIELTGRLTSPLGWVRVFFGKPSRQNKLALNSAVAHPSQNLSVGIVNKEFYLIWREQIYGTLNGLFRIKAQIHDSIFFQYRQDRPDVPGLVHAMMLTRVNIKGADGVTREMFIPSEISCGKRSWAELK